MTSEVKTLICEGACNPNLSVVDAMVRECRMPDGRVVLSEVAQQAQRSLVYTEHVTPCAGSDGRGSSFFRRRLR